MKTIFFYLIILIQANSLCAQNEMAVYSFFTAGHTYGSPSSPHYGLHYPFTDFIPDINAYPNMDLGFLTGDVVVSGTAAYWDSAQADIDRFSMPVYIAAGNHDIGQEFVDRFGDYYFSFKHNNDLFIVLTPGLNLWNISGEQLTYLKYTLDSNHADVNNIFIFLHELIWWSPDNEYQDVEINYEPHYPGSTNFDTVVKPLLLSYSNTITIYAGDLGCTDNVSPFMYHHYNNITLIGSGMGGGIRDNIIITDVYSDSIHYNLVALNGTDPNALGEIYEFSLTSIDPFNIENPLVIYPNPTNSGYFNLKNTLMYDYTIQIFDMQGQLIHTEKIQKNSLSKIDVRNIKSGIYFLRLYDNGMCKIEKIIIQ